MPRRPDVEESLPLLSPNTTPPAPSTSSIHPQPQLSPISRSKLGARRHLPLPMTEKVKGKQRAVEPDLEAQHLLADNDSYNDDEDDSDREIKESRRAKVVERGRRVTVIFSNEEKEGNLELWIEPGETVGKVKDQIRHLRPSMTELSLRLIHSGRLLTDGILLVPWLRSLEDRLRRQASTMGGDVESVLKEVGLAEDGTQSQGNKEGQGEERVWLHCIVGGKLDEKKSEEVTEEETTAPRRRGFDVLLDAGLSPADVANMRREFYRSRGEEMPEGLDMGDVNDEHARALEEQWIEGDLTADTATTSTEGMYSGIMHGLLTGFLFPITPIILFRDLPLPNFFDADAEVTSGGTDQVGTNVAATAGIGGESIPSVVFGTRMQMGIVLGLMINAAFGCLSFLS